MGNCDEGEKMTMDVAEALANAIIGFLVSWAATWAVLGYSPSDSAMVTLMFFGLSFARAWVIRTIFRRIGA